MNHTPGPWSYGRNVCDDCWLITCAESDRSRGRVGKGAPTNADDDANVRLMAAAPDLLAALKEYVTADIVAIAELKRIAPVYSPPSGTTDRVQRVRALITLIEGPPE